MHCLSSVVLSRPFFENGKGIGDGYLPWAGLIENCTRPLRAEELLLDSPYVGLKFVDAGHFVPLEAPDPFNVLLDEFLSRNAREGMAARNEN